MTKVLTSTVLLMLAERAVQHSPGTTVDSILEAEVGAYIPSFNRNWKVVESSNNDHDDVDSVEYTSFLSGETHELTYTTREAKKVMLVKHLISESSGIGYDQVCLSGTYHLYNNNIRQSHASCDPKHTNVYIWSIYIYIFMHIVGGYGSLA